MIKLESLYDLKTTNEVEEEYKIPRQTLHSRIKNLEDSKELLDGIDYRKLRPRQPILFTPSDVKKIIERPRIPSSKHPTNLNRLSKIDLLDIRRQIDEKLALIELRDEL